MALNTLVIIESS